MSEAEFQRLVSPENLMLAWRRVTTGRNMAYKKYFRGVMHVYENASEKLIADLSGKLRTTYLTSPIGRVFQPKPSGLHRSISLLTLEDQIVYQAIANVVALKVARRRARLWGKCVFSNRTTADPKSMFFLEQWVDGFRAYQRAVASNYKAGRRWVAQFDLAAYYDTISNDLLLSTVYPNTASLPQARKVGNWLKGWATQRAGWPVTHGIPQGPIASDLLAEAFMLPVDEWMIGRHAYIRYVDDIRVFGRTELEVLEGVRDLERLVRDRGLVPQSKKFEIVKAKSVRHAMGSMPSIRPSDPFDVFFELQPRKAERIFRTALSGRPYFINDKSIARYVLFRASPSRKLTSMVLKLLARHPEHIDAFLVYLGRVRPTKRVSAICANALNAVPSQYVKGELLQFLARVIKRAPHKTLRDVAVGLARDPNSGVSAKAGAIAFLCKCEELGSGNFSRWIFRQSNMVQSLAMPSLPAARFCDVKANEFRRVDALETNLSLLTRVLTEHLPVATIMGPPSSLSRQMQHILRALGITRGSPRPADPMGDLICGRYGIQATIWRPLFKTEYSHNLSQLVSAESSFNINRSEWLNYQNSFNHALFWAFQDHLKAVGGPGATRAIDRSQFGNLVDAMQPFALQYPRIAKAFEVMNRRRNSLPSSHPYERKTGKPTRHLSKKEQTRLVDLLKDAFADIALVAPTI
jgi:hypothetical protein